MAQDPDKRPPPPQRSSEPDQRIPRRAALLPDAPVAGLVGEPPLRRPMDGSRRALIRLNVLAMLSLISRELRRIRMFWAETLVPPVINGFLYMTIFGTLIGSRIGPLDGHTYIAYIIPGIVMIGVILDSYMSVAFSFYGDKFQRCIEEILVAPIHTSVIYSGLVIGGVLRGFFVGLLILLVASFFTPIEIAHPLTAVLVVALSSALFCTCGLINGILGETFDDLTIVTTFILAPLTYLGGVFYSINLLPDFWRQASLFNPVLYIISGLRHAFLGTSDIGIGRSLGLLSFFLLVFAAIALTLLHRGTRVKS